jgi:hypothetical protein
MDSGCRRANGSYFYQDDFTWIRGKHTSRFGYQYAVCFTNSNQLSDAGLYDFHPRETDLPGYLDSAGQAFASFMLGAGHTASHSVNSLISAFRQP